MHAGGGPRLGALAIAFALVAGCSSTPTPTPGASVSPSATPAAYADTITVGMIINNGGESASHLSNATPDPDDQGRLIDRFLYRALYRYDERFVPIPDLAARPCDVSDDGKSITCALADARFVNGDPITADDVAFTYELSLTDACAVFCFDPALTAVEAVDAKTVRFTLEQPHALFFTWELPSVWIESKKVITSAYAKFRTAAEPIGNERFWAASDAINAAFDRAGPDGPSASDCQALLPSAQELITRGGLEYPSPGFFTTTDGFDACSMARTLQNVLGAMGDGVCAITSACSPEGTSEEDSIRHIYQWLPFQYHPVGSGEWAVKDWQPGKQLTVEAAAGSTPATRRFVFRFFTDRRDALAEEKRGAIDWVTIPGFEGASQGGADLVRFAGEDADLQLIHYPIPGTYTWVLYNQRQEQAMSDPALREAVDRCIDKPAIVEASSDGLASPAWSFVAPGSWAAVADLPQLPRDVAAGRALIQSRGWTIGSDGYFHKDGERLGVEVLVGTRFTQRQRFLELARLQLADCGFDLGVRAVIRPTQAMEWPDPPDPDHRPLSYPGDDHEFQAIILSSVGPPDPGTVCDFDSSQLPGPGNQFGCDASGYRNPEVDRDLASAMATYDVTARQQYYKDLQTILAKDHAALFAWFNTEYDVLGPGVTTTNGPILTSDPAWANALETIARTSAP